MQMAQFVFLHDRKTSKTNEISKKSNNANWNFQTENVHVQSYIKKLLYRDF